MLGLTRIQVHNRSETGKIKGKGDIAIGVNSQKSLSKSRKQ